MTEFMSLSCGVARRFLQSVVVFDDLATLGPSEESRSPERVADDRQPNGRDEHSGGTESDEPVGPLVVPDEAPLPVDSGEIGVDAKALGDSFATEGLVCAFLKPGRAEADAEAARLIEAARRADVVILDWVIHRDEGAAARRIIRDRLKQRSRE